MAHKPTTLALPEAVSSRADLVRLSRELEELDGQLMQAGLRNKSDSTNDGPALSQALADLAQANGLQLKEPAQRQQLKASLLNLSQKAPVVHISLAAEPSADFIHKLTGWLRREVNPQVLLEIGLQPSIAAGCIIRTTNKYFDCSMRQHLLNNRPKLIEQIGAKA